MYDHAVATGALITIENALSTVLEFAVALKVKFEVVLPPTALNPVICPLAEFKDAPAGKEPDCTE